MNEKEHLTYLRRLRFPQPLENEFQRHYFAQNRRMTRICLVAIMAPMLWYVWREHLMGYSMLGDPNAWFVLLSLLLLGVTCLPAAWRVYYPIAVSFGVVVSLYFNSDWLAQIAGFYKRSRAIPDAQYSASESIALMLVIPLCLGLAYRLPVRWMTLYLLTGTLIVRQALAHPGLPPELVTRAVVGFLPAPVLVLWLTAYYQERTARGEFIASRLLAEERDKSERLLLNVLPAPIADRLKAAPGTIADTHPDLSVLFADIVDFTPLAARLTPARTVELLNAIFSRFDELARQHGIEKIKTVGDAYMAVAGLPTPHPDHLEVLVRMALEMQSAVAEFSTDESGPIRLRIGIHTGLAVAGVIGTTKFAYDLWGDTVNTASRLESHSLPGKIQVSAAVAEKLHEQFRCTYRGRVELKGCGPVDTYFLDGERVPGEALLPTLDAGEPASLPSAGAGGRAD